MIVFDLKSFRTKLLFWLLASFVLPVDALAKQASVDLLPRAFVFEDTNGSLEIDDILDPKIHSQFKAFKDNPKRSYGFTRSTVWVYVDVHNRSDKDQVRYLGSIRPEISTFNMYHVQDGQVQQVWLGGASVPIEDRVESTRLNLFQDEIPKGATKRYYFQVRSDLSVSLVLQSSTRDTYFFQHQIADITHFFYIGSMFSLIIYSIFFYVSLRDRNFLYYSLFGISITISDIVYSGFLEMWGFSFLGHEHAVIFLASSPPLSIIYGISFIQVRQLYPKLFYLGAVLGLVVTGVFLLSIVMPGPLAGSLVMMSQFFSMLYVISVGFHGFRNGNKSAGLYLSGWGLFAGCLIVWIMGNVGSLPKNYFVAFAPIFGNIVEMTMTAIALSFQFNQMKEDQFQKEIATRETDSLRTLVQVVCHDIANPLSVISGSHRVASRFKDDQEKQSKAWDRVGRASKSIEAIINQVRRMQAIKVGKQELVLEPVDVAVVFKEVEFNLEHKARSKGVQLVFSIDKGKRPAFKVMADETSLAHDVVNNFVSNAIKFSDSGCHVWIEAFFRDGKPVIRVKDEGIGMPPDILDSVFSENKKTSRRGTNQEAGTGFGMPLAKYFVDKYGGEVEITSKEAREGDSEHGTCIEVTLTEATENPELQKAS
ncbi:sensor histidine kinase [Pseudobacteriovorax antillogorgiicola]|uniref:histidine kinase n=1 Tax=Pseudobacteriovorax antillogorgiicola TaxID=1513793 RepID=A0A1Y6CGQ4_9BACT|nr:sensor histidine kinase [Pseudobacteriovorax antillogorgiicola]TCS49069.1 signal transduction histidine kinase [Pseudobacteriovorax antillogorgiicola]SMF52235.1 Signal transduction histidine kinase [Pseudobacteriovorax antillogorgiicola]